MLMLSASFSVQSQTSATANFTASATIIQPITITTTSDMNFANIDAKNGGQIILTAEIDQNQVSNLGYSVASENTSFEILVDQYGDIVDNLEFTLKN